MKHEMSLSHTTQKYQVVWRESAERERVSSQSRWENAYKTYR